MTATVWLHDRPEFELGRVARFALGEPGGEPFHAWHDAMATVFRALCSAATGRQARVKRRKPRYVGE